MTKRAVRVAVFRHAASCAADLVAIDNAPQRIQDRLFVYDVSGEQHDVDGRPPTRHACDADAYAFVFNATSRASASCIEPALIDLIRAKRTLIFPLLFVMLVDKTKRNKIDESFGVTLANVLCFVLLV